MGEPEWRIRIDRSGGFAGVTLGGEVRSDELPAADAKELDRLANKVNFAGHESAAHSQPGQPDRFQYNLAVDHGPDHFELTAGEATMDASLRELVQWLMPHLRKSPQA